METALERFRRVLPWTVLTADDFERDGVDWMNRALAAGRREIAPDPRGWLTALRFDVDGAAASTRWLDAELPPPNFIVRRRSNGHAHLVYMLAVWVPTQDHGVDAGVRFSPAALRYAGAIDRAMTTALGADPAYVGRFHHNPLATEAWEVREIRAEPYSLAELAQHVDLQAVPRSAPTSSGIGRNVETFERLRRWAYRTVTDFAKRRRDEWDAAVADRAASIAEWVRAEFPSSTPYRDSEVRATARSVARWTWERYVASVSPAVAEARAIVAAQQARIRAENRRRRAGTVPRGVYVAEAAQRRVRASRMRAQGIPVREIALHLTVSVREVYRLLEARSKPDAVRRPQQAVQGSSRTQNLDPARAGSTSSRTAEREAPHPFTVLRADGADAERWSRAVCVACGGPYRVHGEPPPDAFELVDDPDRVPLRSVPRVGASRRAAAAPHVGLVERARQALAAAALTRRPSTMEPPTSPACVLDLDRSRTVRDGIRRALVGEILTGDSG